MALVEAIDQGGLVRLCFRRVGVKSKRGGIQQVLSTGRTPMHIVCVDSLFNSPNLLIDSPRGVRRLWRDQLL